MKNLNLKIKETLKVFIAVSALASVVSTYAEDTEIYYSVNISKPNLLFVMDNSGSMRWDINGLEPTNGSFSGTSRMDIMKDALKTVIESKNIEGEYNVNNANIGVMRYGPGSNQVNLTPNGWGANDSNGEARSNNENHRTHGVNGVAFPVVDITAPIRNILPTNADTYFLPNLGAETETVRDYVGRIIDTWQPSGGTPIVDALYEAALYYRGEQMHYGQNSPTHSIVDNVQSVVQAAHPSTYLNDTTQLTTVPVNYLSRIGSLTYNIGGTITNAITPRVHSFAPNYKSPIASSCQSNYIVLMSDGQPTYYYNQPTQNGNWDRGESALSSTMHGDASFSQLAANMPTCLGNTTYTAQSGRCGPELTKYIATNDNSSAYDEMQTIETFSIGLGAGGQGQGSLNAATQQYLKDLATFDDPTTDEGSDVDGYFAATSPEELAAAFTTILSKIGKPAGSLASPGYSVNVKSGLEHEKDIYVPVFDRKNTSRWSGNIKKFKIVDDNNLRKLRGKNNLDAFDELGGFTSQAHDYWSDNTNPDGVEVEDGGIANKLSNPDSRLLVSNLTSDGDLTATANLINATNFAGLTNTDLGLVNNEDSDYRERLAHYIRGWHDGVYDSGATPKGVATKHMGDMLHSEPVVITYQNGDENGVGKKQYIFATTNEGYLHAFSTEHTGTDAGKEMFAFMPKELLQNINPQMLNSGTQKDHDYGLDGTITYWLKEGATKNNVLDAGEQMILYFGMRRGGTSFYALDVTDIDEPKLLWKKSAADYPSMGQSWSPPYLAKIGKNGSTCNNTLQANCKEVVIISGGYDEDEDRNKTDGSKEVLNASSTVNANVGNDILVLGALDGAKEWSMTAAMRAKVQSSVPGGVRVLDTNNNNLVDRMYFADTGGHIWRLDFSEDVSDTTIAPVLTEFAKLGETVKRKFYNEPDVALMKVNGKYIYAVSVGSGFRAHPLDKTIADLFFVIKDESPFSPLETTGAGIFETIVIGDLEPITISDSGVNTHDKVFSDDHSGWKVSFPDSGEKVLSTSFAFDGVITFSTLIPEIFTDHSTIDACAAPPTHGRFYALNVLTGKAGLNLQSSPGEIVQPTHNNTDQQITDDDVFINVEKGGIPGSVKMVTGTPTVTSTGCKHEVDLRQGKKLSQIAGFDTCDLESVYWSDPATDQ